MGWQAASVHGTTFGLADQRHPIDQGHVPEPWKGKRQTPPPPKPTERTSALALNAWSSVRRYSGYVFSRQRAGLLTKLSGGMWPHRNNPEEFVMAAPLRPRAATDYCK